MDRLHGRERSKMSKDKGRGGLQTALEEEGGREETGREERREGEKSTCTAPHLSHLYKGERSKQEVPFFLELGCYFLALCKVTFITVIHFIFYKHLCTVCHYITS